eukprot:g992.t1
MAAVQDSSRKETTRETAPYDRANMASRYTFHFVNDIIRKGASKELTDEDLPSLAKHDHVTKLTDMFEREWNLEKAEEARTGGAVKPNLWRVTYRCFTYSFWISAMWALAESITRISQPVLLGFFLEWLTKDEGDRDVGIGMLWAASIALVAFIQAIIHHQLYFYTMRAGWNARMAFSGLIHRKLLRLHGAAIADAGKVTNLVSNDVLRFDNFFPRLHFGWTGPFDLIVVCALIAYEVGFLAMFAGTSVIFVTLPVSIYFGRQLARRRRVTATCTDERVRMTNEIFDGILAVKASCWGDSLTAQVSLLRERERSSIFKSMLMRSFNEAISFATPYIATACTFLVFWLEGEELDVAVVFSTMALIHVLRLSVGKNLFMFIENFPEALVTYRRIHEYLDLTECRDGAVNKLDASAFADDGADEEKGDATSKDDEHDVSHAHYIRLRCASFAWGLPSSNAKVPRQKSVEMTAVDRASSPRVLRDIDLQVSVGQLLLVAGPTGCGKSALIQGILGEIRCIGGSVERVKRVAVVEQEPWIFSGTLRENIVWASSYDRERYNETVQRCALRDDIAQLSDGSNTEIGTKGINLSGGQRARVALARAVYADADAYVLDDPLSAVDPEVAEKLFRDVVKWLATDRKKAVVLVTHHTNFVPRADKLLLLKRDGSVDRYCATSEIVNKLDDAALLNSFDDGGGRAEHRNKRSRTRTRSGSSESVESTTDETAEKGTKRVTALVRKEERTVGNVKWKTYLKYLSSGGTVLVVVLLVLFTGGQAAALVADVSLEKWSSQSKDDQEDSIWLRWFFGLTVVATVAGFARAALFFYVGLKSASAMHDKALAAVIDSPMSFFISNPVGRIINKFSSDLGQIDELLPVTLLACLTNLLLCIGALVLSCIAIPWVVIPVLPLALLLWYVRWYFLQSSRALKRLESITKSPVFVAFGSNLNGRLAIRAAKTQAWVRNHFEMRLEANGRAWYHWLLTNRWVGFRLDMITWCVLTFVVVAGAYFGSEGDIEEGLLAIAITYCIQLSGVFQYMVRLSAKVETMMTCTERLTYYTELPSERRDSDEEETKTSLSQIVVSNRNEGTDKRSWPTQGAIDLKNLSVRYREDLPLVLRNVSMSIPAGSKVGVVGRTGSGKSSLMLALSRLNMVVGGECVIDGRDASSVSLAALRGSIGVIPQVPVLFTGSLRQNIDPTKRYSDAEIMRAVESAHLKRLVEERGGLDMRVQERGQNLSVGQRQCISMARAILLGLKIYVMDEATANIDKATDELIQKMVRTHPVFARSTIITVAHRIATIVDSDLIVVLENGNVAEIGAPSDLLAKESSHFSVMARAAGVVCSDAATATKSDA